MEKLSFTGIENSLSRDEMRKIMAGSGYCVPGYACSMQQGCYCSVGAPCCCNGQL